MDWALPCCWQAPTCLSLPSGWCPATLLQAAFAPSSCSGPCAAPTQNRAGVCQGAAVAHYFRHNGRPPGADLQAQPVPHLGDGQGSLARDLRASRRPFRAGGAASRPLGARSAGAGGAAAQAQAAAWAHLMLQRRRHEVVHTPCPLPLPGVGCRLLGARVHGRRLHQQPGLL